MRQYQITINVLEKASIDYIVTIDANSEDEARDMVNNAINRDGTAFIEFPWDKEQIADSAAIDGEIEKIDTIVEVVNKGDEYENHF